MAKKSDFDIESNSDLEEFRAKLINLGLKFIDDLNNKRVQNPTALIDSLANLFSALKN